MVLKRAHSCSFQGYHQFLKKDYKSHDVTENPISLTKFCVNLNSWGNADFSTFGTHFYRKPLTRLRICGAESDRRKPRVFAFSRRWNTKKYNYFYEFYRKIPPGDGKSNSPTIAHQDHVSYRTTPHAPGPLHTSKTTHQGHYLHDGELSWHCLVHGDRVLRIRFLRLNVSRSARRKQKMTP